MILRTEKCRLYPTNVQEELLMRHLELSRKACNHQLGLKIETFQKEGKNLSQFWLRKSDCSAKKKQKTHFSR